MCFFKLVMCNSIARSTHILTSLFLYCNTLVVAKADYLIPHIMLDDFKLATGLKWCLPSSYPQLYTSAFCLRRNQSYQTYVVPVLCVCTETSFMLGPVTSISENAVQFSGKYKEMFRS